ncbi:MAG: ParA family protein [Cyanobacteria bacterium J06642_2]
MSKKQIVLVVDSNAGGVGKSTIAREIAFRLSLFSGKVLLVDLDPSASQCVFTGVGHVAPEDTIVRIFEQGFKGDWPYVPLYDRSNLEAILSSLKLEAIGYELESRTRKEYVLADAFEDYQTPHDVVVIDCPGTRTLFNVNALAVATHMLFVIEPETKSTSGIVGLCQWYASKIAGLRLKPPPQILGLLPSKVDRSGAAHRRYMGELEEMASSGSLGLRLFKGIRYSKQFINSSMVGLPLRMYRPGSAVNEDFDDVIAAVNELRK